MKRAVALAAAMLAASLAFGQDKAPAIAGQVCAACHAADGNSVAPANPKIAGQFVEYLNKQLRDFKAQAGKTPARQSAVMNGMVANLSDADMKSLAAYYAGQSLKPSAAADKELAATGRASVARSPRAPRQRGCQRPGNWRRSNKRYPPTRNLQATSGATPGVTTA